MAWWIRWSWREGDGDRFDVVYITIRYASLNYNESIQIQFRLQWNYMGKWMNLYMNKKWVYVSVCVHLSVPAVISVEWGFGKVRKHDGVHSSNDLNWSRWASLTHCEWRCLLHWLSVQHEMSSCLQIPQTSFTDIRQKSEISHKLPAALLAQRRMFI